MLAAPAVRAQGKTTGVALVIGNAKYQWEAQLPNVRRDAPDIAKRFQAYGLKTELLQDVGRDSMRRAIETFASASRGANLAAFYFAGHGATWAKETYLVPVDGDLSSPNTVQTFMSVSSISAGMEAASHRLMVFDNCRNNPADGWRQREAERSASVGLFDGTKADAISPNTLLLYSTAPGRVALDGPAGENSPFAAALLRQFDGPSVDLQALPAKLRRDLLMATRGRQVLFDQTSYTTPFVLQGAPGKAAAARGPGLADDPSKVIELTNTYAFVRQSGLHLPPGLVAFRPSGNSRHSQKVGAFKFETKDKGGGIVPAAIGVLSVEEPDSAEMVFVMKVNGVQGWRFTRTRLSGDSTDAPSNDQGVRYTYTWKDEKSGTATLFPPRGMPFTSRMTRLDG